MFHVKQLESALISAIFKCYRKAYKYLNDLEEDYFFNAVKYFNVAVFMENEIFSKINNRQLTDPEIAHIITNAFNNELRRLPSTSSEHRPCVILLYSIYDSIPELKQYEGGNDDIF